MEFRNDAYQQLQARGFINQETHSEETKKLLSRGPLTFYLGIDPTADDLHIGHFFALQMFRILQDCGHKGILLIGGATAMIGDPSFKSDMRKLLTKDEVDRNAREINSLVSKFIKLDGDNPAILVNNADWIRNQNLVDFLRNVGVHFNVKTMLAADAYKKRLEQGGLTFFEMSYMLMQAYDFVHLNDAYGCVMQIGGSDQWGNILAGADLSRKMNNLKGQPRELMLGLTCPLLVNANGVKMGKTEKGTLWVSREKTSVFEFFQHFVNAMDEDVERLLRFFTKMPVDQIIEMCKTDIIKAKKLMAYEVTKLVHGEEEAKKALETAENLFSGAGVSENMPEQEITLPSLEIGVIDFLGLTSIISSKSEARRLIEQGGIVIDNEKVDNITKVLRLKNGQSLVIKKGKKTFLKVLIK